MKNLSTIILLCLVAVVGVFTLDVYLPGMPSMAQEFGVSIDQISLTFAIFSMIYAISQLFHGVISDYIGRKPILIGGLSIAAIGTLFCIYAKSYESLLAARILQATGISVFVVVNAIVRDLYEGKIAIQVRTLILTMSGISISIAPTVGGLLQDSLNWEGGFIASFILIIVTLIYAVLMFSESNQLKRSDQLNLVLFTKSYIKLFSDHNFVMYAFLSTLAYSVHFAFILMSAKIFIELLGFNPLTFGYLMIIYGTIYFVSGFISSYIAKKLTIARLIEIGGGIIGVGGVLMYHFNQNRSFEAWNILFSMGVITLGITIVRAAANTGALSAIPAQAGQGSAGLNLVLFTVSALISIVINNLGSEPQVSLSFLAIISSILIVSWIKLQNRFVLASHNKNV